MRLLTFDCLFVDLFCAVGVLCIYLLCCCIISLFWVNFWCFTWFLFLVWKCCCLLLFCFCWLLGFVVYLRLMILKFLGCYCLDLVILICWLLVCCLICYSVRWFGLRCFWYLLVRCCWLLLLVVLGFEFVSYCGNLVFMICCFYLVWMSLLWDIYLLVILLVLFGLFVCFTCWFCTLYYSVFIWFVLLNSIVSIPFLD